MSRGDLRDMRATYSILRPLVIFLSLQLLENWQPDRVFRGQEVRDHFREPDLSKGKDPTL